MSHASDGPDYDFGPYEDEYRGFEIRDDETGRGPLILILALGVLLIFAGVVWNTYRQGVRPSEGGMPVIADEAGPYKRAPDAAGGLEVAGQDNGFYGQMDGLGDPALAQEATVRNPVELRRSNSVLAGAAGDLPPVQDAPATAEPIRSAALEGLDERTLQSDAAPQVQTASLSPVETPSPQSAPRLVGPEPVQVSNISRFSSAGAFQVQLMAVRSEDRARTEWVNLKRNAPNLFAGAALDIQQADLGARGVFFRLRVGSFDSRDGAKSFCTDVKATGNECIVVAKASG